MSINSDDEVEVDKDRAVNPTPKRSATGPSDEVDSDHEDGEKPKKDGIKAGSPEPVSPRKRWMMPEENELANEQKN